MASPTRNVLLRFVFAGLGICAVLAWISNTYIVNGREGLFRSHGCYRDEEFGVTYQVFQTFKGQTFARVVVSEKYPKQDSLHVGDERHWSSHENPRKLYPLPCP